MQHILFKIIKQKPIKINLSQKEMVAFPVHEHYMVEVEEKLIIYKFNPTRFTMSNIDGLTEMLKKHFKLKYNAYSVEVGVLQNQISS